MLHRTAQRTLDRAFVSIGERIEFPTAPGPDGEARTAHATFYPPLNPGFRGPEGEKPILIGHSAGGAFTQVVMDHGYGCAGVVLNSAPTEGVPVVPLSQVKSTFPVLRNPANRHRAVSYDFEQWNYAFTNTYGPEESLAFYDRYHIPASGRVLEKAGFLYTGEVKLMPSLGRSEEAPARMMVWLA